VNADEAEAVDTASTLNDLPQFDLDYELDDPVEPTEVTVYEADLDADTTNWITVDVADAIDLVDVS